MNILGLHFGHDAAASVLRDGRIASYVLRERHSRIKHAISLDVATIQAALDDAGLSAGEIDYCAISSTQNIELIIDDPKVFAIEAVRHPRHRAPAGLSEDKAQAELKRSLREHSLMDVLYDPGYAKSFLRYHYDGAFPEHHSRKREDFARFGMVDIFAHHPDWKPASLAELASKDFSSLLSGDGLRHGFHYPVTVRFGDQTLPGYLIAHHMAHAASCYYQSGFTEAAIVSHDGHIHDFLSGMFFWASGNRIYPVAPHYLALGSLYNFIGVVLGLGYTGPAGKLMGLAGYGQPRFFDTAFVGNQSDWEKHPDMPRAWLNHCLGEARKLGYDERSLGIASRIREPINADIAASTQLLFEETYLAAVDALHRILVRAGIDSKNLCLTGGCALNCPTNSRVARESPYAHVYVEPGCDDSGLAIGAASWLYHNVFDAALPAKPEPYATPYLGVRQDNQRIEAALAAVADQVAVSVCADSEDAAAQDLAQNLVIGWFEGRSEIGPRALGHRSILADPRVASNHDRVNAIKGREAWRPFAPAVLEEDAAAWFEGIPLPSPYMLFTAKVLSDQLPAITHADGSARVQTVDASCGAPYRLLRHFRALTGVPVVLNTSFNGPGEPIVESAEDALRFLFRFRLDALYIEGRRITRRS